MRKMEFGGNVDPPVTDSEAAEQNPVAIVDSEAVLCPAAATARMCGSV